jgi:hypothetical protein
MAFWRILEGMLIQLKKSGLEIPPKIMEDLRAAKSMIQLSCTQGSPGDAIAKAEEYTANVEAFVVDEAQKAFGSEVVDEWLRSLEAANAEGCEQLQSEVEKFVVGVPRDQKWVRVEPTGRVTRELVERLAQESGLQVKAQVDGRLVVYGRPDAVKAFLKATTAQAKPQA